MNDLLALLSVYESWEQDKQTFTGDWTTELDQLWWELQHWSKNDFVLEQVSHHLYTSAKRLAQIKQS